VFVSDSTVGGKIPPLMSISYSRIYFLFEGDKFSQIKIFCNSVKNRDDSQCKKLLNGTYLWPGY